MLSRPCTQRSMEGSAQSRAWGRPLGSRAAGPPPLPVDLGAEGSASVLRELLPHSLLFPLVLRPGLGSIQGGVVCPTPVPSPPCAAALGGGGGGLAAQSCPTLETPWAVAHQAPLSKGFSRQEYWSALPFIS